MGVCSRALSSVRTQKIMLITLLFERLEDCIYYRKFLRGRTSHGPSRVTSRKVWRYYSPRIPHLACLFIHLPCIGKPFEGGLDGRLRDLRTKEMHALSE
ncbi:hypothetical protein SCLCIDRAFT_1065068 [Scleroderma citrinum Foug A]|uniref:Uncharacterized protein n=1 Tax=Scleroderma citrinum Foug A TaxID=1036808 RepID=A0A0C3EHF6_9AGAM|nr:hypothetical protein SCLCIDRAFT_1065068 [Scleroderma citrinum Foug A]